MDMKGGKLLVVSELSLAHRFSLQTHLGKEMIVTRWMWFSLLKSSTPRGDDFVISSNFWMMRPSRGHSLLRNFPALMMRWAPAFCVIKGEAKTCMRVCHTQLTQSWYLPIALMSRERSHIAKAVTEVWFSYLVQVPMLDWARSVHCACRSIWWWYGFFFQILARLRSFLTKILAREWFP